MQSLIHLHILASGSKGNATLVEAPEGLVLIDCGITRKQLLLRADELGVDTSLIRAVIITHEHSDHVNGLRVFSKRFDGPIFATKGTAEARNGVCEKPFSIVGHQDEFEVAGMRVRTFPRAHDVSDPVGLQFSIRGSSSDPQECIGWCTDTGFLTDQALEELHGCRILGIEANHDVRMLRDGPYPSYLKARVGGKYGHLSNDQCAEALPALVTSETDTIVALHISEKNNLPSLAKAAIVGAVGDGPRVLVAGQNRPITVL
ncbi:MAG: MBL fold metallo-hydrolase [Atopobiaceae bacterium]|nr:MBL fold metallo-hydrolase [Atopobiaceae bacterium]